MAEIPDVLPGGDVESNWGNEIRDRTAQRYTSEADRTAKNPIPVSGDLGYLLDVKLLTYFDGATWLTLTVGTIFDGLHDSLTDVSGSQHHPKYTDAEAVAAVSVADDYLKNTGDTLEGTQAIAAKLVRNLTASATEPGAPVEGDLWLDIS